MKNKTDKPAALLIKTARLRSSSFVAAFRFAATHAINRVVANSTKSNAKTDGS